MSVKKSISREVVALGDVLQSQQDSQDPDELVPWPVLSLRMILSMEEEKKGAPLSYREVIQARDKAHCIMVKRTHIGELEKSRGYVDINPEKVWEEWQAFRSS